MNTRCSKNNHFLALRCKDTPSDGSGSGIVGHNWDSTNKYFGTTFQYECPFGKNHCQSQTTLIHDQKRNISSFHDT